MASELIFVRSFHRGTAVTPLAPPDSGTSSLETLEARVADLERQLIAAQKMSSVGELASSITHEFNNILTTIINYAKIGLRHQDPASRQKAFDKILSASQRAARITTGLLSYSRPQSSRREILPLSEVVRDVAVLVEKDLQVHRIRWELNIQGEPHALINPGEIQQVLLNLVVNARQAMKPGGTITVTVEQGAEEKMAEISVRDTGAGIPADKLPLIFHRFYTTKQADARGQGGTGLGLAVCKEIIESHQGRIRVESAVGRGTKFTLKFPLATPPQLGGERTSEPEVRKPEVAPQTLLRN